MVGLVFLKWCLGSSRNLLEKGWRVAVQARSEERLDALDSWLWTYSDESFLGAWPRARR